MVGKFLLFAFVAISLAQAQDSKLENEIKKGLERLKGMVDAAEKGIESTEKDVKYKRDSVKLINDNVSEKGDYVTERMKEKIGDAAEKAEQKAKEDKKPPATFECIEKAEKEALKKLQSAQKKYAADVKKLDQIYPVIDEIGKPLNKLKNMLKDRYKQDVADVKACKDTACIKKILEKSRKDCDRLFEELQKIVKEVDVAFNDKYVKAAYGLLNAYNKEVTRIQEEGVKAIKACVSGKFLFGAF